MSNLHNSGTTGLYNDSWASWSEMKKQGPASRWLRYMITALCRYIPQDRIQKILDVGCGEGTNTALLAEQFPAARVMGIDFSSEAVKLAERNKQPNLFYRQDLDSLALQQESYGLITCFEVLEHVEDWKAFLTRMVSASSDYLMLSFPTGRMRKFEKNVGHIRNFRKGEVEAFLLLRGFQPVRLFYAGFPFYNPLYRELCNLHNSGGGAFEQQPFGWKQRAVSAMLYFLFRYCSTGRFLGDKFCGLFKRAS